MFNCVWEWAKQHRFHSVFLKWNHTIVDSFQTAFRKPDACFPYYKNSKDSIGFLVFLWNEATFSWFHFKLWLENMWFCCLDWKAGCWKHWLCNVSLKWNHFRYFWNGFILNFAYTTWGYFACINKGVPKPLVLWCFSDMKPHYVFSEWFLFKLWV